MTDDRNEVAYLTSHLTCTLAEERLHPSARHVLQYFKFAHLPPQLREVSMSFCRTAIFTAMRCGGIEATVALRKLLEAKDAAVRSALK